MRRRAPRVLMIAHAFPPAGGSGANRALAFARYLPAFGWRPLVLTPDLAWAAHRDDGLLRLVPSDLPLIRTPSFEPRPAPSPGAGGHPIDRPPPVARRDGQRRVWRPLMRHVGHLKRFPDAHLGWLPYAVAAGRQQDVDLLYSSSGPFTSHLVAGILARVLGKPWVAELRDGWYRWNRAIFPDYPVWRDAIERRLEAASLGSADRVVLVTERMAQAFRRQYAGRLAPERFAVIANGFDPALLAPAGEAATKDDAAAASESACFEIVHTGALYYGRSIASFLAAAAALAERDRDFGAAVRLTLVGTLDPAAQAELAASPLGGRICSTGQLEHAAAVATLRRAGLLLLIANTTPGAAATVPGKLFEYLAVGRPILAVAPAASSTADVLAQTGGAYLADGSDTGSLERALASAFAAFRARQPLRPDPQAVARYDRRRLTGELAQLFDQVQTGAARRL